jgi:hypothetical protein
MKTLRGFYRTIGGIWVAIAIIVLIISLAYLIFFNIAKNPLNNFFIAKMPVFSEIAQGFIRDASPTLMGFLGLIFAAFVIYLGTAISSLQGWARTVGIVFHIALGAVIAMLALTIYDRTRMSLVLQQLNVVEFVPPLILAVGLILGVGLIGLGFQMGSRAALEAFAGVQPQAIGLPVVTCPTCGEPMDVQNERCPRCDVEGDEVLQPSSARLVDIEDTTEYMVSVRKPVRIGREGGDGNDDFEILLPYGEISSDHAMIEFMNGVFILHAHKDLNFTYVNEVQLRDSIIKNGDTIGFGPRRFRFEVIQ